MQIRNSVLLVSGGLAVSGIALTLGALGAGGFLRRGSVLTSGFVTVTVVLVALAAGSAVPSAVRRLLCASQPRLSVVRSHDHDHSWRERTHSGRPSGNADFE